MPFVDTYAHSLRPHSHQGVTVVMTSGHPLSSDTPSSPSPINQIRTSRGHGRRSTWGTSGVSAGNATKQVTGPERFFYDKDSYTGVHTNGRISTIDAKGFAQSLRSGHQKGSTFMHVGGKVLSEDA